MRGVDARPAVAASVGRIPDRRQLLSRPRWLAEPALINPTNPMHKNATYDSCCMSMSEPKQSSASDGCPVVDMA